MRYILLGLLLAFGAQADWRVYELRRVLAYECNGECVWVDSRDLTARYGIGALWVNFDDTGSPIEQAWYAETEQYGLIYDYDFALRFANRDVLNLQAITGERVLYMAYSPDERMAFFVDDGTGRTLYFNYWPPERF